MNLARWGKLEITEEMLLYRQEQNFSGAVWFRDAEIKRDFVL